jgi:hypothetical protein
VWRFSLGGAGTRVHNEHTAMDARLMDADPASGGLYWHVLDVTLAETTAVSAVGIGRGAGVELAVPVRTVATRVRFVDAERRPITPPEGDLHHRNETLVGSADPLLLLHLARGGRTWTTASRLGLTLPLGRTVPDPFELGRQGIRHQHVQFGTGTWDPLVGLGVGRRIGPFGLSLLGLARFTLAENDHGYRAGHRYHASLRADRALAGTWWLSGGFDLARENAERWHGRRDEEEGNLGRTDLLLALGVSRSLRGVGALSLSVGVPLLTRSAGAQLDYPVIVSVGLAR